VVPAAGSLYHGPSSKSQQSLCPSFGGLHFVVTLKLVCTTGTEDAETDAFAIGEMQKHFT
jgi:hypothetical protein